jgi:hypothetical protein
MKLTNTDLIQNRYKYSIESLEENIAHLDKKIILSTQNLTSEFCAKYIYDGDIIGGDEDSYIYDIYYILRKQKHISENELAAKIRLYNVL